VQTCLASKSRGERYPGVPPILLGRARCTPLPAIFVFTGLCLAALAALLCLRQETPGSAEPSVHKKSLAAASRHDARRRRRT